MLILLVIISLIIYYIYFKSIFKISSIIKKIHFTKHININNKYKYKILYI